MKQALALFLSAVSGASYDYAQNGADWPSLTGYDNNQCGSTNQSPINLVSKGQTGAPPVKRSFADDDFAKDYTNQFGVSVTFNGHTSQTDLDTSVPNFFKSKLAATEFGGDQTYNAAQFHFHAAAEHTIDGVRHDLEMHSVHLPTETKNDVFASAMGIMFSVDKHNADLTWAERKIIDSFFDGLKWSEEAGADTPVTVDYVAYGNLMELVDNTNRWAYKGSLTTPPCTTFVYFNVLSTIYPISQEHLDLFKKQLNQGEGGQLAARGNYREIQTIDNHGVVYIENDVEESGRQGLRDRFRDVVDDAPRGLVAGVVALAILTVIFLMTTIICCMKYQAAKDLEVELAKR